MAWTECSQCLVFYIPTIQPNQVTHQKQHQCYEQFKKETSTKNEVLGREVKGHSRLMLATSIVTIAATGRHLEPASLTCTVSTIPVHEFTPGLRAQQVQ